MNSSKLKELLTELILSSTCHGIPSLCENCLFTNDCLVKDNTQLTKRGVYVPSIIRKEQTKVYLLSLK